LNDFDLQFDPDGFGAIANGYLAPIGRSVISDGELVVLGFTLGTDDLATYQSASSGALLHIDYEADFASAIDDEAGNLLDNFSGASYAFDP
ncbi:MAG: hypothetical protein K0U36_03740, partial [Alphaproteobacteria bacterium]|nr:hypothetical protein [Alphaproteobacteria bacterium]